MESVHALSYPGVVFILVVFFRILWTLIFFFPLKVQKVYLSSLFLSIRVK